MVVEHNRRSAWTRPFREHRDAPLGGDCGETMQLEAREPIYTLPHLSRHPNGIHEAEQFWLEVCKNQVRR